MASPDPEVFDPNLPPPRPTTPPVRRGFLRVLAILMVITALAYGVPYTLDRAGYAWEAGRSRAAAEALAKLDETGVIKLSSALFRSATEFITPAVVNVHSFIRTRAGNAEEIGSGFVIDRANGYIVTNEHVVRDADQVIVRIGRTSPVEAELVGIDERTDLAVLKVKGPLGVQAEWGESSKLEVGDWVLAIGSPFALDRSVTAGIVSATGRHGLTRADAYEDYIQTDAAINPGNSGGPLINLRGQVIGINTAIYGPTPQGQGIGMAISEEIASKVVKQIIANGKVIRAYIGVISEPLFPAIAKELGLPDGQEGVIVGGVRADSPAAKVGIQAGDILVDVDGKPVSDPKSLRTRAFILPIGSEIPVSFYRGGERRTVKLKVEAMPELIATNWRSLGLELAEIPQREGGGVVVSQVDANSPAQSAGIHRGMRIAVVGRTPVRSRGEYEAAVSKFDPIQGIPLGIFTPAGGIRFFNITSIGAARQ